MNKILKQQDRCYRLILQLFDTVSLDGCFCIKMIEVIKTAIEGVVIIEPKIFTDSRGYFMESFSLREFEEKVRPINFVQDNESMSSYGVMRG